MPPSAPFEAPSLEGLRATVPGPKMVQKEDVVGRIELLRRHFGTIKVLAPGELVAAGDEVVVDSVGFSDGKVLAFTTATDKVMDLKPDPELPGYTEAIVGMAVGSSRQIELRLPAGWPELPLRLAPATFEVELKAGRRITKAPVTDPAFLAKLGGKSLQDVGNRVGQQIQQEWRLEAEGRAMKEILAKVTARVNYRVPNDDIDREIELRWQEAEGNLLQRRKVREEARRKALEAWLMKPRLRDEVAQQIKETLVLEAIAEREGVKVEMATLLQDATPVLATLGIGQERAKQLIDSDARFRAQLAERVRRYKTVELVMSQAKVKVSDSVWGI